MVAALALIAATGCKPLDDTMVAIFGRSMRDSRSFDPYENPLAPAENSVSFSSGNFPAGPGVVNIGQPDGVDVPPFTQQDMTPIGVGNEIVAGMANPISPDDEEALARGEVMYERFCAVCHGPNGVGANAYIAQKHPTVAVYNVAGPAVQAYSDQYIYGMIRVGRGLMPEYGSRISHFDRWKIVNYVRLLQSEFNGVNGQQDGED
jgi:mono/diheme cytochrome c family protein